MRLSHLQQNIVLKGFFITLLLFAWLVFALPAKAQNLSNLNPQQIAQLAKGGQINQAAQALSGQSGIKLGEATKFVQGLQGGKVDLSGATKLVQGLTGGKIDPGSIGNLTKMVQGLQNGQANPAAITGLINQVAGGQLPADVGKILGQVSDLGKLANIKSISDIFKNPEITKAITDVLGKAGLPADLTKALESISAITKLISDPAALLKILRLLQKPLQIF